MTSSDGGISKTESKNGGNSSVKLDNKPRELKMDAVHRTHPFVVFDKLPRYQKKRIFNGKKMEPMSEIKKKTIRLEAKKIALDEEKILAAIRHADDSGCSFRLVCQLAATNTANLTSDQKEILRFVE